MLLVSEARASQLSAEPFGHSAKIGHLKMVLAELRRMQFGRRSEKLNLQIASGNLIFEDLETEVAVAKAQAPAEMALHCKAERKPLPAHLPRDERILRPGLQAQQCHSKQVGSRARPC